jgi:cephalosporin hydroxylase
MTDPVEQFRQECIANAAEMFASEEIRRKSLDWIISTATYRYTYNFTWLGRPVIQFPQDLLAMQEIIWRVRPDLIIETGIAHGGSLIFYASMLELLGGDGEVIGIDIDIRVHNRAEVERHAMYRRIRMIEGSSTDVDVVEQVKSIANGKERIMVVLDSNHSHAHVRHELQLYSPLVTRGSYLVVFDTVVEDMPDDSFPDRPWGKGDNPKTAVQEFLTTCDRFEVDREIEAKLLITVAPEGYLRCIKD